MDIRLLGPVELWLDDVSVELGPPKQRALLAMLALDPGTTVSLDRLVEGLWGIEGQPATAPKMVQLYVSQLRRLLGDDGAQIVTRGRGYELQVGPEAVDALRFERLVATASASEAGTAGGQAARAALRLWRGPALADVIDAPFAAAHARRLDELRLAAEEVELAAELNAGRHAELVGRLESRVRAYPLRERLHELLMLALYGAGRQAEALDAYRSARETLVEEAGLEPGPQLRRLQDAILRQDPVLDAGVPDPDWARQQTAEQVASSADATARRRGELREGEATLTSGLVDLQDLRHPARPAAASGVCPFKGLASYHEDDAAYFFGRERLVAELVARLVGAPLLGIVGPSGSGKSSALRAGLLPALAAGALPGSEGWRRVLLRPGTQALQTLRETLTDPATAQAPRLVLAVDQFEELFTACPGADERAAFVDALVDACEQPDDRVVVLLAVRADFYGACVAHPRLARLLAQTQVLVGPMRPEELARAIEGPATRAGLSVEPALVDRLTDDVGAAPGALPLLSTALLELWQDRDGAHLRLAAYERTGGVEGAVARLAEQAYGRLALAERDAARRVLLRLAGPGDAVRRRVPLDELDLEADAATRRALEVLADGRLITLDDDTAEVAHEALLREWPRLRGWLEEDAEGRRLHRRLAADARDWNAGGRDPAEVYRGARLAAALDWAGGPTGDPNRLERAFLEEGRAVSRDEVVRTRRVNRRLRALLACAVAGLALAVGAGLLALDQRGDARDIALVAEAQRVGAQAITEDDLDRRLLLARAGVDLADGPATRGNLLSALLRAPAAAVGVLRTFNDDAQYFAAAVSPDGRVLALGDAAGTVSAYDLSDRRLLGRYLLPSAPGAGVVQALSFSLDGRTLAVGGQRPNFGSEGAVVDLVDVATLRRRARASLPAFPGRPPFVIAEPLVLADGDVLVAQTSGGFDQPSIVRRIDGRTGRFEGRELVLGRRAAFPVATPDRRHVFLTLEAEDATYEIDPAALRVLRRHPAGGRAAAATADGRLLALGGERGSLLRLLDLRTGKVRRLGGGRDARIVRLAFTDDARTLASSDGAGTVRTWNVTTGAPRERFEGHRGEVWGLAIASAGQTLISAGDDGRAVLWDLAGPRRLVRRFGVGPPFPDIVTPRGVAVSPDGRTLAVTRGDGGVEVVDTRTLRRRRSFRSLEGFAAAVAYRPDGRVLAVTGQEGRLRLHDARTGRPAGELHGLQANSQAVAWSPDGRRLAAAEIDTEAPRLRLWDVRRRTSTSVESIATNLVFSPDGRYLATAGVERGTEIRDARTLRLVQSLALPDEGLSRSVAFSRDGRLLAVGTFGGEARLYATEGWRPLGQPLQGHTQRITTVAFTPRGDVLVTASADGTTGLWDTETRQPLGERLTVRAEDDFVAAALTPDGAQLLAVPTRGPGVRLRTRAEDWLRHACLVAGRSLTREEWHAALPRQAYRAVCRNAG